MSAARRTPSRIGTITSRSTTYSAVSTRGTFGGRSGVRFGMRLNLAVTAALAIEAETAPLFFEHPVLFENDLAVGDPTGDLVERFGNQQQRRLRHPFDWLAVRIVVAAREMKMDCPWSR